MWAPFIVCIAATCRAQLAAEQSNLDIPVKLSFPASGFASVAVYNDEGEMIRTLACAKPVEAGEANFDWDGTTDLGLPAAPGRYRFHGVWFAAPPRANYLMKVGLSGNPPYLTDNDRGGWGANLGPPMDICANSQALLCVFLCAENPKETGIQMMDLDGNIMRRFASFFGWDGRLACTMDETNAYLAIYDGGKRRLFIGKYILAKPPRGKILCDIPAGDHFQTEGLWKGDWTTDVKGLAVNKGRLYVPLMMDDRLFVVDTGTGKIMDSASIPSPRGVTVFNGRVFVLSGKTLLPVNDDGTAGSAAVVSGLDDPSGVATDATGNFYITDQGEAQDVKVFSPNGLPLREIGIRGGRPRNGPYNAAGLLNPRGLCIARDGKVWVTSGPQDFQEITVWNSDGTRDKVFYNCSISSGQGRLSPNHDEMLVGGRGFNATSGLTAYKIDWIHKSWSPSWHIGLTGAELHHDDVLQGHDLAANNSHAYIAFDKHSPYLGIGDGMVQGINGKTYLVGGEFSIWLFDPVAKVAKLASLVYTHRAAKTPAGSYHGFYTQGPNNWLTWADLDGDGKMNVDEVTFTRNPALLENTSMLDGYELEPDLSILIVAPTRAPGALPGDQLGVRRVVLRLRPKEVLPTGVPVYDWADLRQVAELQTPDYRGGDGGWKDPSRYGLDQFRTFNGAVYASFFAVSKTKVRMSGVDGDGWWASRNWRMSPMKFDLVSGRPSWLKLGRRAASAAKPGEMYYPGWGMAGSIDGIDYCADALSQVWAWTDDGLFLGRIYNDNPRGPIFDANGIYVELTGSFAYKINGKTYLLTGDHGVSVHQIDIPPLTRVDGGPVILTAEQAAEVKPWDPDGPPPGRKPAYIARTIGNFGARQRENTRTITIDGILEAEEWKDAPKMKLTLDGKEVGTVQVTFDKTNLYLAYDIQDRNGLKNDGHELPYAPFVSGSYVDFDMGPDWSAPNREKNLEGDVRVIMARITGGAPEDYQMAFWPLKRNLRTFTRKPKKPNPQDIVSPVQERHFDDISPIADLKFAYKITERGYTLEASVPLAGLGLDPARQPVVGFDASVGFADASGQVRERASHWAGESETIVVDRPGSAELKPQTWGTLQFDQTLLSPVNPGTGDQRR